MQKKEDLGPSSNQEAVMNQAVIQYFESATADMAERDRKALALRLGVYGPHRSFTEIGVELESSRQNAEQLVKRAIGRLPDGEWEKLEQLFPKPTTPAQVKRSVSRSKSRLEQELRGYAKRGTIQYGELHRKLGIPVPERREKTALLLDEQASCRALLEDYGIKRYGKFRYCSKCVEILPIGDFYKSGTYCKTCNTERCVSYFREHPEATNERSKRWRQNNPERARQVHKAYLERKAKGIRMRRQRREELPIAV